MANLDDISIALLYGGYGHSNAKESTTIKKKKKATTKYLTTLSSIVYPVLNAALTLKLTNGFYIKEILKLLWLL